MTRQELRKCQQLKLVRVGRQLCQVEWVPRMAEGYDHAIGTASIGEGRIQILDKLGLRRAVSSLMHELIHLILADRSIVQHARHSASDSTLSDRNWEEYLVLQIENGLMDVFYGSPKLVSLIAFAGENTDASAEHDRDPRARRSSGNHAGTSAKKGRTPNRRRRPRGHGGPTSSSKPTRRVHPKEGT